MSLSKHPDFLICREYIYGNTKQEIRCFRKYILYICGNGAYSIWFQNIKVFRKKKSAVARQWRDVCSMIWSFLYI